jgi:hypothetical protein
MIRGWFSIPTFSEVATMLTKKLPVMLTDEEIRLRGQELASLTKRYGELEREKKENADVYKSQLETCKLRATKLTEEITSGQEDRDVQIEERKDWDRQQVLTIRLDTYQTVDVRAMTPQELRRPMALPFGRPARNDEESPESVVQTAEDTEAPEAHEPQEAVASGQ